MKNQLQKMAHVEVILGDTLSISEMRNLLNVEPLLVIFYEEESMTITDEMEQLKA